MAAADMLTFIMQKKGRCMIVGKEGSEFKLAIMGLPGVVNKPHGKTNM